MENRREFLKKAALLAGTAGFWNSLPQSIQRALAITPPEGSTYLDAEHIVVLMQENRSFDHMLGSLQGVRGFDDPRAIQLPDGLPVWLQSDQKGETFAPFRLDFKDSKSTWMHSLPHSWPDQVDARNGGRHNGWLDAKRSGNKDYQDIPLTLGYYTREDLPFYYALADAFTVCDQNFCSSLTGTTPNRLYLWSGTVRKDSNPQSKAHVRNSDVDYDRMINWKTFPERLEDAGISWKIYQNEISLASGFDGDHDAWLANFTDNPLEWFEQYHVRFSETHYRYLQTLPDSLNATIKQLENLLAGTPADHPELTKKRKELRDKQAALKQVQEDLKTWHPDNFTALPKTEQSLHEKAFTTNKKDPDYRELSELNYQDGKTERSMILPKGDSLYQFRKDVQDKQLPTVSWLVAPENFSDHPGAPWYGAWYVSEVMDILTKDPEVWKKTIFILCYDENDGLFDHVPPFVPPHPDDPYSGQVSEGMDVRNEFVSLESELNRESAHAAQEARQGPIGLGYRVPLFIASPWSRGGRVCSQVFDHTSILQFMEHFLSNKTGKTIREDHISDWRRTVCGDLRSVFQPYHGEQYTLPASLVKDDFLETVHKAQFKDLPKSYHKLSAGELEKAHSGSIKHKLLPHQEKGMRPSCALPYQLDLGCYLSEDKKSVNINFVVSKPITGEAAAGAPFQVYILSKYRSASSETFEHGHNRAYAVKTGTVVTDFWRLADFENGHYHLRVYGPNGFFQEFKGNAQDPPLGLDIQFMELANHSAPGAYEMLVSNNGYTAYEFEVLDNAYGYPVEHGTAYPSGSTGVNFDLTKSHNWYDFTLRVKGFPHFEQRIAGRLETGKDGMTDPLIGRG